MFWRKKKPSAPIPTDRREAADAEPQLPAKLVPLLMEASAAEQRFDASGDPKDLEAVVHAFERVVQHPALAAADPRIRSGLASEAGRVLMQRFQSRGARDDLNGAIALWSRAVDEAAPRDPALPTLLSNLAAGLVTRHRATLAREDLDRGIECLALAERIVPASERAWVLSGFAAALDARHRLTGNTADLERAIALSRQALETADAGSPDRAAYLNNVGALLDRRFSLSGDLADLDSAIEAQRNAIALTAPTAAARPLRLQTLGRSLTARHRATGRLEDLQHAIDALGESVNATAAEDPQLPARLYDLGTALLAIHHMTRRINVIQRAVEMFDRSVALTRDDAPELPARLSGLAAAGNALAEEPGADLASLDGAIDAVDRALVISPPSSASRPQLLTTLGNALVLRYRRSRAVVDLDRAIDAHEKAAASAGDASPDLPSFLNNLAVALRLRHDAAGGASDLARARDAYRRGIDASARVNPDTRLVLARNWGIWAAERGSWEEAADAFEQAISAAESLYAPHVVRAHKETWLQRFGDLPADAAYALARSGRIERAAEVLERGRARFLTEALDRGRPDSVALPKFDVIANAAATEPIVYIAVSNGGGVAVIVASDGGVQAIRLDDITDASLRDHLSGYGRAYENRHLDLSASLDALDALAGFAWDAVMGPIVDALADAESAVLVTVGLLGLLPLHAAWTSDASTPSGRRYALDALRLSFSPNARTLTEARRRGARGAPDSAFIVADPGGSVGLLPHSEDEAREVAAAFARSESLISTNATRAAVLDRLSNFPVVHLSCHATADITNPLGGALKLADGTLTIGDLAEARLENTSLIVLSACETALVSTAQPDEVIGFPSALLRAGARGVVGSMWAVPEVSTLLVMARFYEMWRGQRLEPGEALRRAQGWVRDATNAEKLARFPALAALSGSDVPERARSFWSAARAHAHPYHWAAFSYIGG